VTPLPQVPLPFTAIYAPPIYFTLPLPNYFPAVEGASAVTGSGSSLYIPPYLVVAAAPVLLSLDDLRRVSAEALGNEIAAISPDYVSYSALFVSFGFDGELLCSVINDSDLQQLVQDLGIGNAFHRRRVLERLRVVRARYHQSLVP
jgi:hypothetical protein